MEKQHIENRKRIGNGFYVILHLKTTGGELCIDTNGQGGWVVQLKETEEGLQFGKERGSIDDPISSTWASRNRHLFPSGHKKSLDHHYRPILVQIGL